MNFLSNFYVQLWALIAFSIYILPFVVSWGRPRLHKDSSRAYLYIAMPIAVLLLWPISILAFVIAGIKLLNLYLDNRARTKRVTSRLLDDLAYEKALRALEATRSDPIREALKKIIAEKKAERAAADIEKGPAPYAKNTTI